jgi:hypothetical protein
MASRRRIGLLEIDIAALFFSTHDGQDPRGGLSVEMPGRRWANCPCLSRPNVGFNLRLQSGFFAK